MKYLSIISYLRLGAANLALLLGSAAAHAQTPGTAHGLQIMPLGSGVTPNPPIRLYCGPYKRSGPAAPVYVNGQLIDDAALAHINPDDIAAIRVVSAPNARKLHPDAVQAGALIITTKAGEHTHAVRAFNRRLARMAAVPSASTN